MEYKNISSSRSPDSADPVIEYNWSENLGVLGGAWFSVYGRNSLAFVQGVFSVCWTFPVVK